MTKRVFVVWTHPFFHKMLQVLLSHPDIDWAGETSDHGTANLQIENSRADAVLIEEVEGYTVAAQLSGILDNNGRDVCVIGLNLSDNRLNLYKRKQLIVRQANELVDLILT